MLLLIKQRDSQMQDSTKSQRGKSKKEPTVYNVPEYRVPEDLDAAIFGEVDLRDKTNAAHTLPTAFFERFNTLRQQVCKEDIVSARSRPACSLRDIPTPINSRPAALQPLGLGFALQWCTFC